MYFGVFCLILALPGDDGAGSIPQVTIRNTPQVIEQRNRSRLIFLFTPLRLKEHTFLMGHPCNIARVLFLLEYPQSPNARYMKITSMRNVRIAL